MVEATDEYRNTQSAWHVGSRTAEGWYGPAAHLGRVWSGQSAGFGDRRDPHFTLYREHGGTCVAMVHSDYYDTLLRRADRLLSEISRGTRIGRFPKEPVRSKQTTLVIPIN